MTCATVPYRFQARPDINHLCQMIRHTCESIKVALRIIRANCFAI